MKVLTLALLLSVPIGHLTPQKPLRQPTNQIARHGHVGRWYFAANGHAIYCYGPVMTVPTASGDIQRVATICRDGSAAVPLKD
jgi:hypothetical protein